MRLYIALLYLFLGILCIIFCVSLYKSDIHEVIIIFSPPFKLQLRFRKKRNKKNT